FVTLVVDMSKDYPFNICPFKHSLSISQVRIRVQSDSSFFKKKKKKKKKKRVFLTLLTKFVGFQSLFLFVRSVQLSSFFDRPLLLLLLLLIHLFFCSRSF
ncbi:hypothetical protein ACMBCN_02580, partial [Candidatus Liberibacter asiaticus]|nr:hypothetical protein [Candidatus Liberibacter asiaticus]